ncbi:MAG TPA: Na+/H+ antiporter NhaA [Anaeromyxobacter sp.]|nr:Na+/H+ antiporter NhaA [Anaeromyxobacter sp.]
MASGPRIERTSGVPPLPPLVRAVARPVAAFFRLEAASGILLLGAAAVALAWANLAGASYRAVVETPISVRMGPLAATFTLHALVNDGLMALFFFVVGMEIKRELVVGELRSPSRAALPLVAALGGMVVPAAIYLAWNAGGDGRPGWGIPMATDIAFAIGILTLLRSRIPHALLVFVTALAIFDDVGGILVIALFYGSGVSPGWIAGAAAIAVALGALSRWHVRSGVAWACGGAVLWYAFHRAGLHPTLAGVALGLVVPARGRVPQAAVLDALAVHARELAAAAHDDEERAAEEVLGIEGALEAGEPVLARLIAILHPWVAFGIVPAFALVNSGVEVAGIAPDRLTGSVAVGTAVALLAGKALGIFAFAAAAVKLGLAPIPGDAGWTRLLGASAVAGIGFTVALFIAALAFPERADLLDEAKLGILAGSLAAGVVGALVLRSTPPVR